MASSYDGNLQQLAPSRKKVKKGDIFVMKMKSKGYIYGRVISDSIILADPLRPPNTYLIYIYSVIQKRKLPIPDLCVDNLLLPPIIINRQGWLKGYFENVGYAEIRSDDRLPQHCFWDEEDKAYYDDRGNKLKKRHEPCGEYGLSSYAYVDWLISKAIGLPIEE